MELTRFIERIEKLTALLTSHNFSHALDRGEKPTLTNRGALVGDLVRERPEEVTAQNMLNLFRVAGGSGKDQSEQMTL
jgi:ABC-type uncharacterized transport system ATPase component